MSEPNEHNVIFTAINRHTSETCTIQNIHECFATEAEAVAHAIARIERDRHCQDDGTLVIDGRTLYWSHKAVSYRVHSYFDALKGQVPPRLPEPFSGPEWDEAWRRGPGRDAE